MFGTYMSLAMSGISLPTEIYCKSFSEEFPNNNRTYKVERCFSNRYYCDYLSNNVNFSIGNGADNHNYSNQE